MRISTSPTVEPLEPRRLMSVTVAESEPNDLRAHANGIARLPGSTVHVGGAVNAPGDRDWFKVQLQAGDIVGAVVNARDGLDPMIRLTDASGKLMISNDDSFFTGATVLPVESPLPRAQGSERDSEIYYTISQAGTYYLETSAFADGTTGPYDLEVLVTRPALEKQPVGAQQILFLDFDGAKVDFDRYLFSPDLGKRKIAPLSASLPALGLSAAADENTVIDEVIRIVTAKLSTFVRANGANDNFGIEIRNSRDHADEYGKNPLVSRIVVGAMNDPAFVVSGRNQTFDVGNFKTDDEAIAGLDDFLRGIPSVPITPPATMIDALALSTANLICHEMGHLLGCFHTDQPTLFEGTGNLMDTNGIEAIGPDFIFGSKDDVDLQFGVDSYDSADVFRGTNDTLNTVAFALSTGTGAAAAATAGGVVQTRTFTRAGASTQSSSSAQTTTTPARSSLSATPVRSSAEWLTTADDLLV
jgi:large repetitive protein